MGIAEELVRRLVEGEDYEEATIVMRKIVERLDKGY